MILSSISDTWEWASAIPMRNIFSLSTISNALAKAISSSVSSFSSSFSLSDSFQLFSLILSPISAKKNVFPSQIDLDKQDLHLHR